MKDIRLVVNGKDRRFKSIKEAANASGIAYITLYQRLRIGVKGAAVKPVRQYNRKAA